MFILVLAIYQSWQRAENRLEENAPYVRDDYKHWIDADHDCQNTRKEVLIAESLEKITLDSKGCKVLRGKWYDFYTDKYFSNPNDLDIDHFVPLKEAHISGAQFWSLEKKQQYANDLQDPEVLIAVSKNANRAKGDKDPSDWLPENKNYQCEYIKTWQRVKKIWALEMDKKERAFIEMQNKNCSITSS
jgi:5-methylcytosine-specific restriction endonuclease McrA